MLVDGEASLLYLVQLRVQDMPPEPSLHAVSPPYWASKALTLRALHPIARTSYRVSFLLRDEWSRSFHPTVRDKLVGIVS